MRRTSLPSSLSPAGDQSSFTGGRGANRRHHGSSPEQSQTLLSGILGVNTRVPFAGRSLLKPACGPRERPDACSRRWGHHPSMIPSMSVRKTRLTITVDPHLAAYAEHLVEKGKASSVSAVVNDALSAKERRDRRAMDRLKEIAAQADPDKVAWMLAHIDAQAVRLPES